MILHDNLNSKVTSISSRAGWEDGLRPRWKVEAIPVGPANAKKLAVALRGKPGQESKEWTYFNAETLYSCTLESVYRNLSRCLRNLSFCPNYLQTS